MSAKRDQCLCSEEQLILDAQKGERAAESTLLSRHQSLIKTLARRMHTDEALYEELIQAGNLGMLLAIRRFRPEDGNRLTTYAFSWILGEMKRALRDQDWTTDILTPEGSEQLLSKDVIDLRGLDLRLAMERLDNTERMLILLRFFRDKTQAETALLLHKSQSQISKLERRALDRLREWMD